MASLSEIVARARTIAEGRGIDPFRAPWIDAGMTAETLVPHCIRAALSTASAADLLSSFVDQSIEIDANGVGVLPDSVLRNFLDESYLPEIVHSSYSSFPDFNRSRFDNMLCYYTTKGNVFKTSCAAPLVIRTATDTGSGGTGSTIIGFTNGTFSTADIGRRIKVVNASTGVVYADAFITAVNPPTQCMIAGFSLSTFVATNCNYTIYDASDYVASRVLITVSVTSGSNVVNCAGAAFTAVDIGRRLRVIASDAVTVILDAIIATVVSGTQVTVNAKATGTDAACTASVMYSPIHLVVPSVPVIPTDPFADIPLPGKVLDASILLLAGALTGEIKIEQLLQVEAQKEK